MAGNTFFIADNHFYHKNIIKYENRPFKTVEEMNEYMIEAWNNRVKQDDRIFILGDFVFGHEEQVKTITRKLNGYKILVCGNHDKLSCGNYFKAGFEQVSRFPIIFDNFLILSHEPMYINSNMPYGNIYGHVHSNPEFIDYTDKTMCVSVERKHINYVPISYEQMKELMENKRKDE